MSSSDFGVIGSCGMAFTMLLAVTGCADFAQTRASQQADDQQRCASYGYVQGTDAFADCMMHQSDRRDYKQARVQANLARMRQLSLDRCGDPGYPLCTAANMDAHLDTVGNFWYGDGCRAH